jgi:hypothetical protein
MFVALGDFEEGLATGLHSTDYYKQRCSTDAIVIVKVTEHVL